MATCKHSFILIQKSPYERVKHCTKCHLEIGETEKVKAKPGKDEPEEEKSDAE